MYTIIHTRTRKRTRTHGLTHSHTRTHSLTHTAHTHTRRTCPPPQHKNALFSTGICLRLGLGLKGEGCDAKGCDAYTHRQGLTRTQTDRQKDTCTYIHKHICTHIHTYTHTHTHTQIYTHTHPYTNIYTHTPIHIHTVFGTTNEAITQSPPPNL